MDRYYDTCEDVGDGVEALAEPKLTTSSADFNETPKMGSVESYSVLESGDIQRWTAKRKSAVVLEIVKGKSTPAEVARKHGNISAGEVQGWIDEFFEASEERMRERPRDLEAQFEAKQEELHANIGEHSLQIDALKKCVAYWARSFRPGSSENRARTNGLRR